MLNTLPEMGLRNVKFPARMLACVIAVTLLFNSCVKEEMDMSKKAAQYWNPNLAAPLVYSSLTIQDILKNSDKNGNVIIGPDKFCTLIYEGTLFSIKASDFINIPNQNYNNNVGITLAQAGSFNGSGSVTIGSSYLVNYNPGSSIEIDSVKYKAGNLNITINPTFQHSGIITISVPSAKKNGIQFSYPINYNYTGTPITASLDMTGYTFDMTNGGTQFNQFNVNFNLQLTKTSGTVSPVDQVGISMNFVNQKFDRIFGYVGQQFLSPNKDTVLLSIFNNSLGTGTFTLKDPRVHVYISNSYGVPIQASFSQFDSWNPKAATQIIPFTGAPNPLPIKSPTMAQIGQSAVDSFKLTNLTSNIVPVINNTPKYVIYKLNSTSNPAGNVSQNFVLDSSQFKVDMKIELPLYGTATNFTAQDTIEFKFQDSSQVESVMFRIYADNGFPIDMDMQLYFVDSLYNKLDSMINPMQRIIPSAVINPITAKVAASTQKTTDCYFDRKRLNKILNTQKVLVKGVANTTSGTPRPDVKIYSYYKMDIKFGVQAKLKIKF